jgi:hypothetical protein
VAVSAGEGHTVARRSDGQVLAWGNNAEGQCNIPAPPAGVSYVEIVAGLNHTLARRSDGQVVAFGDNGDGQCNVPALPAGVTYVQVDGGRRHSVARRSDGQAIAWGWNFYGQCNVPPAPAGVSYVDIAAGSYHNLARRSDGHTVGWGFNEYGQSNPPTPEPGSSYFEIGAGGVFSIARFEPTCDDSDTYCTAKTNSLGCSPFVSLSGLPSASAGLGCTISAAAVLSQKVGLFLHSTAGAAALPFHGGTLCVQAPLKRHPASSTGGTGLGCTGVLSEDLNDYIASGADPALVAGATVWLQAWSRDPADPFGDSLSNALRTLICP